MRGESFTSPRDERRPEGAKLLWAASGYADQPLPVDVHTHRGVEVGILLAGEEEFEYSDLVVNLRPGDVWLCNIYEPHGVRLRKGPRRSVVAIFLPEFIGEEMLGELPWLMLFAVPPGQRPRVSSSAMRQQTLAIGNILRGEIEAQRPRWESVVRLELLRLLIVLSRGWHANDLPDGRHGRPGGLARIMPALSLVHSMPWHRVRVPEAAAACLLSVSQFHTLFAQTMGMTFHDFCLRARVSFAAHRMLNTDKTIAAIAAEAGFTDGSHLNRCFLKVYNCTPAKYRERSH
jgi:AraC-like DNA-binding protein